ncbi:MAG: PD-(D/E)XK nuclease family protein [Lachnospiraceae bacterium]
MAIQFILGSSGSGKSHYLYEEVIRESIQSPDKNYIVIVPEQFTMGTQQKIVQMHPNHGVLNVDIVSFQRLAYKVFEELGVDVKEILDDTGKSMIIRKILEDHREELSTFKKNVDKAGFVEEVKSAVSEMLQYGVDAKTLRGVQENLGDNMLLRNKLEDLITVYDGFKNYIKDRYIASEEILEVLCRVVGKSRMIKGSVITLDGFTGFTPIQYRLLRELMMCCDKLLVTLTMDSTEQLLKLDGITNLFYLSKDTAAKLYRIADETHVAVLPEVVMDDAIPWRLRQSEGLTFLEKNIFRYKGKVYDKEDESVQIFEGAMPKNEVAYAAAEIMHLIMEKGYHYRDFAIVSADIETYGELCVNILSQNGIPSFLDYKHNIMENAAVSFLRGALQVLEEDFSYESVFGFLKTGLAGMDREDVDVLENYCLALGCRGYRTYNREWTRITGKMERKEVDLEQINRLRTQVLMMFVTFRESVGKASTVRDLCVALYEFMVHMSLEEKLKKKAREFADAGLAAKKGEYDQVYGKIIGLLDKFVNLLGTEKMKIKEFNDILDAGFREIKIGLIPQVSDAVIIGDIERTRLENVKILFLVGVNDGVIPKQSGGGGLISEYDKEVLREHKVELSMPERDKVFIQKFYLYLSLTKPSKRLYLSYAGTCSDGNARRMSYLLVTIRKLYPKIRIAKVEDQERVLRLVRIPRSKITWKFAGETLDETASKELYGDQYKTSISAIETYSACAFAHFVTYGLRLSERELYDVKASDIGTLYHNTLERVAEKIVAEKKTFTDLTEDDRKRLVTDSIMEISRENENAVFFSTKRNEYMISRLVAMTDRTIWAVGRQLEQGKFVPTDFERSFTINQHVRGRIDRIDTYVEGDDVFLKVVDYKTGERDFDLLETYYGLEMQLATYMNAAIAMERKKYPDKNVIPAGLFYYNIKNPFVEDEGDIEDQMLEKLRVKGIVNRETAAVRALDEAGTGKSSVIPVSYNKDGEIKESANVLTRTQIEQLLNYVEGYIKESVDQILTGDVKVNPYLYKKKNGCEYCKYRGICGFDRKVTECRYRNLRAISPEEIFHRMEEKKNGNKVDG